jgi:membrane protease YdiL (CAAX protease family)
MKDLELKNYSLSLYFVIAFSLPTVTTIIVALVAGLPSDIVVKEMSASAVAVVMAMVHAPTIAAMIVVFRSQSFEGIKALFRQLRHWDFSPHWYLKAILIFPATILAVLLMLSLYSSNFDPVFTLSILAFAALFSPLWEEIGWTGFATPVMLRRWSPLQVALLLGFLHAMWHLPATIYGASVFHGDLFIVNFVVTSVGIVGLRIVTIWIYMRTRSLVLGWLTHVGFTGGQLLLVPLSLSSGETVVWNSAFSVAVTGFVIYLLVWNKDWMSRQLTD